MKCLYFLAGENVECDLRGPHKWHVSDKTLTTADGNRLTVRVQWAFLPPAPTVESVKTQFMCTASWCPRTDEHIRHRGFADPERSTTG